MQAGERVGIFLKRKLQEINLKKKDLAREIGIPSDIIYSIFNSKRNNISFKTVLNLADYFECSIDEALERNLFVDPDNNIYQSVTSEEAMNKIRNFMMNKFKESDQNIPKFSVSCGLDKESIREFIKENSRHKNLFCNNIITIADHFNISIDELIGRSNNKNKVISNNKVNATETTENPDKPKDTLQKLPAEDAVKLEEIKQTYEKFQNEIEQKVNTINGVKSKVKDNSRSR